MAEKLKGKCTHCGREVIIKRDPPKWQENYNKDDLAHPEPTLWQEGYK